MVPIADYSSKPIASERMAMLIKVGSNFGFECRRQHLLSSEARYLLDSEFGLGNVDQVGIFLHG